MSEERENEEARAFPELGKSAQVGASLQGEEQKNQQVHTLHFTAEQIARISSLFADAQKVGSGDVTLTQQDRAIVHKLDQAAIRARYHASDEEVAKSSEDLAQRASLRLRF